MHVLLVNATMRRQSTYHMAQAFIQALPGSPEVQEVFLPRDLPAFCTGCGSCFTDGDGACPHHPYTERLWEQVRWADLLVFANPVYVFHVTGGLKNFFDHFGCHWMVHRPDPKLFTKQAAVLTAAAGGGMRSAEKDVLDSLHFWGVSHIYTCRVRTMAISWEEIPAGRREKLLAKAAALAKRVRRPGALRATPAGWARFRLMGKLVGGLSAYDKAYWKATF